MNGTLFPDEAGDLYGLPLEEFTAARNALAKELASSGERELADRVRKLRKPTRAVWAVNRAARAEPKARDRFLASSSELAEAQERLLASGDRDSFEAAVAQHRAALDELLSAVRAQLEDAGGAIDPALERARTTLEAVAGDEGLREELAAARLTQEHEAVGFTALSTVEMPRRGAARRAARPDRRRLRDAKRRADSLRRQLDDAKRKRDAAKRRVEAAERQVAEAEEDMRRLEGEVGEADAIVEELT